MEAAQSGEASDAPIFAPCTSEDSCRAGPLTEAERAQVVVLLEKMATTEECTKYQNAWKSFDEWQANLFWSGPRDELRFKVGDAVRCKLGSSGSEDWSSGKVDSLWFRESGWPRTWFAPYTVCLDDQEYIDGGHRTNRVVVPADSDVFVVAASGPPPAPDELMAAEQQLLQLGWASAEARDAWVQYGYTQLHGCCMPFALGGAADEPDALGLLLRRPLLPIDDQDNVCGDTPLHIAVEYRQLERVRLLLAAGADPTRQNAYGQDVVEAAKKQAITSKATYGSMEDAAHILQLVLRVARRIMAERPAEEAMAVDQQGGAAYSSGVNGAGEAAAAAAAQRSSMPPPPPPSVGGKKRGRPKRKPVASIGVVADE